jgi:hypothetical protein
MLFTPRRLSLTLGLAALMLAGASAAEADSGISPDNSVCLRDFRAMKHQRGWKALAVSNHYFSKRFGSTQSCGTSWDYSTRNEAITMALANCRYELRRWKRHNAATCRITYVSK